MTMRVLRVCEGCRQHVRVGGGACPFCGRPDPTAPATPPRWLLAIVAAPLLAVAGCDSKQDAAKPAPARPQAPQKGPDKVPDKVPADDTKAATPTPPADTSDPLGPADDDSGSPDDANAAGSTGAPAAGDESAPPDNGATVTKPVREPISKPKYGVARPPPEDEPRPPKKYGAPPKPPKPPKPPEPLDPFGEG